MTKPEARAKAKKAKVPTLDELVAQERECRELLESSLRDLADAIPEQLPAMESLIEDGVLDYPSLAAEIALHGSGIDYDATEWGKAAEALAKAMANQKKAA